MELNILKTNDNYCFCEQVGIEECAHLQPILHALKYYTLLKLETNPSNACATKKPYQFNQRYSCHDSVKL